MNTLKQRYQKQITGSIECFDRVIISGTLPRVCYADGMASLMHWRKIRLFDYPKFVSPFKEQIRNNAQNIADQNEIEIEFIRKKNISKEKHVQEIIQSRGDHAGLVCILSAMESCNSYEPWHNKKTHKTYLRPKSAKCLHYYFYFIDEQLGLCFLRVPTWAPFRLQFYFNGHNLLARK